MNTTEKKISVRVRKKGEKKDPESIFAVLYGAKRKSISLFVNKKDFQKMYKEAGESTLINLEIEGEKEKPAVLIYDIQQDPIKGEIIHADFFEPNLKEEVETEIPLVFYGESPAVKEESGTLVKNFYSIEVKALPQDLPHEVRVDIGKLKTLHDVIHIEDLEIPENVHILHDKDSVVAMVSSPEDVDAELEKPVEEGEEPEVIGEKEEEEEEKEKVDKGEEEEKIKEEKKE